MKNTLLQVQDLPKEYKNLLRSIGVSKSDWKDPTKREVIVNTFNDKLKEIAETEGIESVDRQLGRMSSLTRPLSVLHRWTV